MHFGQVEILLGEELSHIITWYRGADKSLARPTSQCTLFDGENISFDASLVIYIYIIYYRYSALGPVWAETRAQTGDRYGSGTLRPGQVLRGSFALLSPVFRRSHFRHQLSPRPPRRERS